MNPHSLAVVLLVICHTQLFGKTNLNGILIDNQTKNPIEYATIYINGTTNGTISNTSGFFELDNVNIPCQLVVSRIGYVTQSVTLNDSIPQLLNLFLTPWEIVVDEVTVTDKNLRENNILTFRKHFLGNDVWGKNAEITNEDALIFSKDYETKYIPIYDKQLPLYILDPESEFKCNADSTQAYYIEAINFKANANAPLIINLPLLGYSIYVNLISFVWRFNPTLGFDQTSIRGCFYFKSIIPETKRDSIRINKNRLKAYYNSSLHFCRSLYKKELGKNGYRVFDAIYFEDNFAKQKNKTSLREFKLDSCLNIKGSEAEIIGLKDRFFYICYYPPITNGTPIDLTGKNSAELPVRTLLSFMNDTCIIRNDGTTPGNSLTFGSIIGTKKVGAMLPSNYEPTK